jgi:7-cyano-7-deazaguanine synthase
MFVILTNQMIFARNQMKPLPKKAVVLLSGGLDSATTLAMAKKDGFDCYAMTFRYGQRHSHEIICACRVALSMAASEHRIVDIDLAAIGGSALTDSGWEVPKDREDMASGIPITYVPARNTIFLSYALAWAEVLGSWDIYIGVNATDYSGYPDCRPEYIEAFEHMANLATRAGVENKFKLTIRTPLIHMTKAEIIKTGIELNVDYSMTHSCYDPSPERKTCGQCDSCLLRKKGFDEAGIPDPASTHS